MQRESARLRPEPFRLSVVTPMYNEEAVCDIFFRRLIPIVEPLTDDYEIVCINDGSTDRTLELLRRANAVNPRIKAIDLSRNFGKELALTAGLNHASGDAVIPFDADLQDPPELIPEMVALWKQGYDVVLAVRSDRSSDSSMKRMTASLFYGLMDRLGDVSLPANAGDFRLMDQQVVQALRRLPERTRFMKGLFAWLGFRQTSVSYRRPQRVAGETKWKAWPLWNLALEGVFSFSTLPLRMWTYAGILVAGAAATYLTVTVAKTIILGIDVPGYASLLSVILFFSGLNMIGLGIIGEYLGRVFLEVKQRPLYLVRETVGFHTSDTTTE
ncbi:MAG: glycosyltransferase family 2 protein [Acidobacteria bacterium]|nr:glycosyltransferase family 2 protein [Acidobacteriota bacterium]